MTLLAFAMPGATEMIIIGIVAVLLFGRRLPKIAFDMGNSFTQFKKGLKEPIEDFRNEFERERINAVNTAVDEARACQYEAKNV